MEAQIELSFNLEVEATDTKGLDLWRLLNFSIVLENLDLNESQKEVSIEHTPSFIQRQLDDVKVPKLGGQDDQSSSMMNSNNSTSPRDRVENLVPAKGIIEISKNKIYSQSVQQN